MFTRRKLLIKSVSLAAAAALSAAKLAARQLHTIGIRCTQVPPEDTLKTYQTLEAMGYREMEATYREIERAWPAYRDISLRKVAVSLQPTLADPGKEDEMSRALDQVKKWGFTYATLTAGGLMRDKVASVEKYRVIADLMNRIGEKCRAVGLGRFLYHSNPYEFEPVEGTTGFQLLMDGMDKNLCALQMDVYWVKLAGHDPAELLRKFSGRVVSLHLKDQPPGLPTMYQHPPGPNHANYLDVGSGIMDWPTILRAAALARVQHYLVEPDGQSASDAVAGGQRSWEYLSKLNF